MREPEPAVVPVNVTEQLATPTVVERVHEVALRLPPVVPGVSVKVTVLVGEFEMAVVSATVAVTVAVQLDPPRAMLQEIFGTLVEVLSFAVADTVTVAAALALVL